MVNVSQDVINYFNEGNLQTAAIEFSNGKESFTITEADIVQGGLKIDRYSVTNSKIEVGSAVASELSLKLRNYDGKFDNVSFEGAVLYVKVGVWSDDPTALGHFVLGQSVLGALNGIGNFILGKNLIGDAGTKAQVVWIPCGRFIIDTSPRKLQIITVSALDYMVKFDKAVDVSKISFPIHVDALIQKICELCSVSLLTDVTVLPNHQYSIGGFPSSSQQLTYRQCLQWCAQLTGTCAFMNEDGQLVLKWYEQTAVTVTMNERYTSDLLENDITITGFTCDVSDEATYLAGTNEYALDLSDCGFLTNSYDGVLKELLAARGGFSYRPYSATIKSAPYLFPMDMIRYKDKDGAFHNTIVTNVTFSLNCNTSISGAGETVTSYSYAQSASGVTSQQAATDRANLEKINQTATQTNQTKNDLTQFKTKYSSDFEKTQAAIESRVTKETYQTGMDGVSTRIGVAETKISQNADAITLRATKEELRTAKSDAIDSAAADATRKATAAESNAKSYADAQLKVTNEKIETKVSKGDIASTINQTAQSVQIKASKINLKGAVTTEDISSDGLNAKVIQAGTITATEIKADTITAGNIGSGQIIRRLWQNATAGTYIGSNGSVLPFQMSTFPAQNIDLEFSDLSQIQIIFKGNRFQSGLDNDHNCFSFSSILVPLFDFGDNNAGNDNAVFYTASVPLPSSRYLPESGDFFVPSYTPAFSFRSFQIYYSKNHSGVGGHFSIYFWDAAIQQNGVILNGKNYNDWCIPYRIYGMK